MRCVSICLIRIRKGQAQEAMLQVINASGPQTGKGVFEARENAQDSCDYVLHVQGMMCGNCEAHVKKDLEALSFVKLATASHERCISYRQRKFPKRSLKRLLERRDTRTRECRKSGLRRVAERYGERDWRKERLCCFLLFLCMGRTKKEVNRRACRIFPCLHSVAVLYVSVLQW